MIGIFVNDSILPVLKYEKLRVAYTIKPTSTIEILVHGNDLNSLSFSALTLQHQNSK